MGRWGGLIGSCVLFACGSSSHGTPSEADAGADAARDCVDGDADGYGEGADCAGADCDDADGDRHEGCGPDCATDALAPGCPCADDVEAEPCYRGPDGTAGVGACAAGVRTCRRNMWSACEGEVVPLADETCNAADDDCDGEVDEGTLSECGDCNATCRSSCAGVACITPFSAGRGTRVENDGALVSAPVAEAPSDVWLATSSDIVRVSGPTRTVVGRYEVGERLASAVVVVVDGEGSAYATTRAEESFATVGVVKVLARDCPDHDGDGRVETSTTEVALPFGQDECLVWRAELDDCDLHCEGADWLALTDDGDHLWVHKPQSQEFLELESETGERTGRSFVQPNIGAMVDDGRGHLWLRQYPAMLVRVPTANPDLQGPDVEWLNVDASPRGLQGAALDIATDGTIFTGSPLSRIEADDFLSRTVSPVEAWSIAIDGDGDVWSANESLRELHQSTADLEIDELVALGDDVGPSAVAADRSGDIWVATGTGLLLLDQTTGEVLSSELAGCNGCLGDRISLYGDPTGMRFDRTNGAHWARGEGTAVIASSCPAREAWTSLNVELYAGRARVWVRAADSPEALGDAPWAEIGIFPRDEPAVFEGAASVGAVHEVRLQTLDHPTRVARVTVLGGCVE